MADSLPDPTPGEALALILGAGTFWACWGVAQVFFNAEPTLGIVLFAVGFAAGFVFYGAVTHVLSRHLGMSIGEMYLESWLHPIAWFRDGAAFLWYRALAPTYFRRAARSLRWPEGFTLAVLAALLLTDLVLFVVLIAAAPSGTRS